MGITVPKFDMSILAATDDIVSVVDELDCGHCLAMCKDSLDGVAEVHIPKANVLINATRDQQSII